MVFGLLGEGSSDSLLVDPIEWLLRRLDPTNEHKVEPIDLRAMKRPPKALDQRIVAACREAGRDVLLVHRDADGLETSHRFDEIDRAADGARRIDSTAVRLPIVPIVPIRMTEAWLLLDETAIRKAAGNAGSRVRLDLPASTEVERVADPKARLDDLLRAASETTGRRRRKFRAERSRHDIAAFVDDWSGLEALSAFQDLRSRLAALLEAS